MPNAGLDIMVSGEGDHAKPYVLEINQRPHIGTHSFPMEGTGQGNAVAEAIVDFYFPETMGNPTHSRLSYDFGPIRAALATMQLSELSLPVIGPDWKVLRFSETGMAARAMLRLIETAAQVAGVFVMSAPRATGGVDLCLACASANFRIFLNTLPAQFRQRLQALHAEAN